MEKRLGKLPGSFELLGEEGVERQFVIRAPNHQTKKLKAKLSQAEPLKVVLVRIQPKGLNKDLEDPFGQ